MESTATNLTKSVPGCVCPELNCVHDQLRELEQALQAVAQEREATLISNLKYERHQLAQLQARNQELEKALQDYVNQHPCARDSCDSLIQADAALAHNPNQKEEEKS